MLSAHIPAWCIDLDVLSEAHYWGEPPCATCSELQVSEELPEQLNQEQVFNLAQSQLKSLKPFYLEAPPSDFTSEWCPNYQSFESEKKLEVWSWIFTRMAYHESSYNSAQKYDEGQTSTSLVGVVSTGLLQISFNSSQARTYLNHGCPIRANSDLVDPEKNLGCGVAMVAALIKRDDCFTCGTKKGAGAYWSVLRKPYTVTNQSTGRRIQIGKKDKIMSFLKEKMPSCSE